MLLGIGLFQKKSKQGERRGGHAFFKKTPPVTLALEISDKTKHQPWKFHKIMLHPLEVLRKNTKTHGISTRFLLDHPWKFHFSFHILLFQYP